MQACLRERFWLSFYLAIDNQRDVAKTSGTGSRIELEAWRIEQRYCATEPNIERTVGQRDGRQRVELQ